MTTLPSSFIPKYQSYRFRLATSEADLATGYFHIRGLRYPDFVVTQDYTRHRDSGAGGQSRVGWEYVILQWDELRARQAAVIRRLVETAEVADGHGAGVVYATVPYTIAVTPGLYWLDIYGLAHMPEWRPVSKSYGLVYETVSFRINAVTRVNDPSDIS